MTSLPVVSAFAALFAVALVGLSGWVTLRRVAIKASVGDAGDNVLRNRIRAQGNFTEYVPLALLCLALVEGAGTAPATVWALGGVLAMGRVLHAAGMFAGVIPLRIAGMVLTYAVLLGAAGRLILAAIGA